MGVACSHLEGVWGHAPPPTPKMLDALRVNLAHLETKKEIQIMDNLKHRSFAQSLLRMYEEMQGLPS